MVANLEFRRSAGVFSLYLLFAAGAIGTLVKAGMNGAIVPVVIGLLWVARILYTDLREEADTGY